MTDIKSCPRYVISDWPAAAPVQWTTLSSVSSRRMTKSLDPLNGWFPPITSTSRVNGWSLSAVNDGSLFCLHQIVSQRITRPPQWSDPSSLAFFAAGTVVSFTTGCRVWSRWSNKLPSSRTRLSILLHCVTYTNVSTYRRMNSTAVYRIRHASYV